MVGLRALVLSRRVLGIGFMLMLAACSNNSSENRGPRAYTVSGSIGDGPIVNALVTVTDANQELVAVTYSDDKANYKVRIPVDAVLPVTVHVRGGTDLVTQRGADFEMVALLRETGEQTVNVSPLTTLAVKAAQCAGSVSESTFDQLWQIIGAQLSIGLDTTVFADPMTQRVTTENVETAVLANEALGEMIRRTGMGLQATGMTLDEIVDVLACDLASGSFDGIAAESVTADDSRVFAVAKAAEVGIRMEVLAGSLHVDGQDATYAMNAAVATIQPGMSAPDVNSVPIDEGEIQAALDGLALFETLMGDGDLKALQMALSGAAPEDVRTRVIAAMNAEAENTLTDLPERVALASDAAVEELNDLVVARSPVLAPFIALGATPDEVASGGRTTLNWWANNAQKCEASGGWQGARDIEGSEPTPSLQTNSRFELVCTGLGGTTMAYVDVFVEGASNVPGIADGSPAGGGSTGGGASGPVPQIAFSTSATVVEAGGEATLTWSAQNATGCAASGAWSGNRAVNGSQRVGPISGSRTFTLTCTGTGGSAVSMVTVSSIGRLAIAWQPPTHNVDGTELEGIGSYRVHVGSRSGSYDEVFTVSGNATSHTLTLPVGTYYVAMTTIDLDGHESALSNEVSKVAI